MVSMLSGLLEMHLRVVLDTIYLHRFLFYEHLVENVGIFNDIQKLLYIQAIHFSINVSMYFNLSDFINYLTCSHFSEFGKAHAHNKVVKW